MPPRRSPRTIPLRYDDGFRAGIAMLISTPVPLGALVYALLLPESSEVRLPVVFAAMCVALSGFFLIYLVWTHRQFTRLDPVEARRIAAVQQRRGPSRLARLLGFARTEDWAMSAAAAALLVAITASVLGARHGGIWLPMLVLLTAGCAWATMVYAFALRYFRLDAGGERIDFDISEDPAFIDFVSMAVMVSSVGALSAGNPRTRAGLGAVRTHTFIAFAFNALVVAMIVSLVSGFLAAG